MVEMGLCDRSADATKPAQGLGELTFLPMLLACRGDVLKRAASTIGGKDAGWAFAILGAMDQIQPPASPTGALPLE